VVDILWSDGRTTRDAASSLSLPLDDSDEALITSLYPPISADQGHSKPRDINPLMFGGGGGGGGQK
jgi:hypothetical protein